MIWPFRALHAQLLGVATTDLLCRTLGQDWPGEADCSGRVVFAGRHLLNRGRAMEPRAGRRQRARPASTDKLLQALLMLSEVLGALMPPTWLASAGPAPTD